MHLYINADCFSLHSQSKFIFRAKCVSSVADIGLTQTLHDNKIVVSIDKDDVVAAYDRQPHHTTEAGSTNTATQNSKTEQGMLAGVDESTLLPERLLFPPCTSITAKQFCALPVQDATKNTEPAYRQYQRYPHAMIAALCTLLQDHAKYLLVELTFDIAGECNNNFACLLVFCHQVHQEKGLQMLLPWHGPTWEKLTKNTSGALEYDSPDYKPFVDILSCNYTEDATYQQLIDGFVTSATDNVHGRQIMSWMAELCQVFLAPALDKRSRIHPNNTHMRCTKPSYMQIFNPGTYTRFAPAIVCIADAQVSMQCQLPVDIVTYCMQELQSTKIFLMLRELCTSLSEQDRLLYTDVFYFLVMLVLHKISGKYRRDFLGEDIGHITGGVFFADGDCEDKASAFISVVRALEQDASFCKELCYLPLQNQVQVFMARGHCIQVCKCVFCICYHVRRHH